MLPAVPHEIEIVITPDGKVQATVLGVQGPACTDISKFLDQLGTVEEDRKTPDFYQRRAVVTKTGLGR